MRDTNKEMMMVFLFVFIFIAILGFDSLWLVS